MARIYAASSWRNPHQPWIVELLRNAGHQVYDFRNPFNGRPGFAWSELDPDWKDWTAEQYRHHLTTNPIAAAGYISDLRAMEWADTCLLILPAPETCPNCFDKTDCANVDICRAVEETYAMPSTPPDWKQDQAETSRIAPLLPNKKGRQIKPTPVPK